jgi:hypothetical protein
MKSHAYEEWWQPDAVEFAGHVAYLQFKTNAGIMNRNPAEISHFWLQ